MARIAFLGGTGPEGLGLALRFAAAGEDVIIGSRQRERAEQAAATLREKLAAAGIDATIRGYENEVACQQAEVVALTLPFEGVEALLTQVRPSLAGKMVLDVVNPLLLKGGIFRLVPVTAGSAGELVQQLLPEARVVAGFKNLSAKELLDLMQPLHGDVLLCGDDAEATRFFASLVQRIPQLRAVDAGSMANAHHLESITTLLLNLNRRYRSITSVQVLGLKL